MTRSALAIAAAGLATAGIVVAIAVANGDGAPSDDMSARAATVMPFDLATTTHTFAKTETGGVQTVLADDPADTRNIDLIRSHLAEEARAFRRGDYTDPARIHGMEMPGMRELEAAAASVEVSYGDVAAGGRITYSSADPAVVGALHAWFDRQRSDHAMPGMGG